jgi:hypothetical protein
MDETTNPNTKPTAEHPVRDRLEHRPRSQAADPSVEPALDWDGPTIPDGRTFEAWDEEG